MIDKTIYLFFLHPHQVRLCIVTLQLLRFINSLYLELYHKGPAGISTKNLSLLLGV